MEEVEKQMLERENYLKTKELEDKIKEHQDKERAIQSKLDSITSDYGEALSKTTLTRPRSQENLFRSRRSLENQSRIGSKVAS